MRRLNVKLTLWLVGITLFSVVGVHFLHGYQIDRNADFLKVQAEQARTAGRFEESVKQYNQYLKHRDDRDGYSALAKLVVEIAENANATRQHKSRAYTILEEAIRRHPDLHDVRRQLVDYTMKIRRFNEALEHIAYLRDNGKSDAGLELKAATCYAQVPADQEKALKKLYEIVGYNPETQQFVAEPPPGGKEPKAFELLAILLQRKGEKEKANAVMDQLVAWNPESGPAHMSRGVYLFTVAQTEAPPTAAAPLAYTKTKHYEEATRELARALELAPDDIEVLITVASHALLAKEYDKANELLNKALKIDPSRQDIYFRLAILAEQQGDKKKAIEQLEAGIKHAKESNTLLERLVDLQIESGDYKAARETVEEMRKRQVFPSEFLRYHLARLAFYEGSFLDAAREFEALRLALQRIGNPQYIAQADLLLGNCYEMLGQVDRQLDAYSRLLRMQPEHVGARRGEALALQALGRYDEAVPSLKLLAANAERIPQLQPLLLQMLLNDEMRKPEAERNWDQVDRVAGLIYAQESRSELDNMVLKADLLMVKGQLAEAQELLNAARKIDSKQLAVWSGLAKLMARDERRRDRIPQLLALAEKELGDVLPLRLEKSRVIVRQGGEKASTELKQLEEGLDKFPEAQQLAFWGQLGTSYLQVGDYPNAKRCWQKVLTAEPRNAQIRQTMFELATDNKDTAGTDEVLKEIANSQYFGSKSALYKYCEASKLLGQLNVRRQGKTGPLSAEDRKDLAEIRKLVDEGLAIRGQWSVLWRIRGELDQIEGNYEGAVANYQRSLDYNQVNQGPTARRLVQLLHGLRRYTEANVALKYVGPVASNDNFRKLVQDIKRRSGSVNDALAMAKEDTVANPDNAVNWVWYGQLLENDGQIEEAEKAYAKATQVGPTVPEGWDALVRLQIVGKKRNEAVESVRKATEHLTESPLALAVLHQRLEQKDQAEAFYAKAVEQKPEDLMTLRRVADYYLATNQSDKANELLDRIITIAAKPDDPAARAHLTAARRSKGDILAARRDYKGITDAIKLVEQNAQDGKLNPDDSWSIIRLLAVRPDRESREKAIRMLVELEDSQPLTAQQQSVLGQLYNAVGDWEKARERMLNAISNRSDDPEALIQFIQMFMQHDELEDAGRWLDRLEDLVAKSKTAVPDSLRSQTTILRARLLAKQDKKAEAGELLAALVPRPLPPTQLIRLEEVARLMEQQELYEPAEKLLNEYISLDARGTIGMAAYLGRRGEVDKAFQLLEEARKNQPAVEILPCALEALRRHPDQRTPQRYAMLEEWGKSAMQVEADARKLKMLLAELNDQYERYPEAAKIYRDILANHKAQDAETAIVQNNLAFVLALAPQNPAEANESVQLINEAIKTLGPASDLLDTRGLCYLAAGKTEEALADLRLAVKDDPSTGKLFHLAQAEKKAGNVDAARKAMEEAEEAKNQFTSFTPLEQRNYDVLLKELK